MIPDPSLSTDPLVTRIQAAAYELGFMAAGCFRVEPSAAGEAVADWVAAGRHGTMSWIERHVPAKGDPRAYWPEARSGVVVALPYYHPTPATQDPQQGRISRYAWGRDYHKVLRKRLERLQEAIRVHIPGVQAKLCVDTAPLSEKDLAQRAGIGWIGKHGNLIRRGVGSWFFLGVILLDAELPPTPPATAHCGSCTRCIDACPTTAIVAPGQVDARRCISYLTIEHRGAIPEDRRPAMGNLVYGCDICQDVCPHNRFTSPTAESEFAPRHDLAAPSLDTLLGLSEEGFLARFAGSPIMRTKRRGMARNAAVALGNAARPESVPALAAALGDPDPTVRAHVAWALGQIGTATANQALEDRLAMEAEADVRAAIARALGDRGT